MRLLLSGALSLIVAPPALADKMSAAVDCLIGAESLRPAAAAAIPELRSADAFIMARVSRELAVQIAVRMNAVLETLVNAEDREAAFDDLEIVATRACDGFSNAP